MESKPLVGSPAASGQIGDYGSGNNGHCDGAEATSATQRIPSPGTEAAARKAVRQLKDPYNEAGERVYCVCRRPDDGSFMINCDSCKDWYHGRCIGITKKVGESLRSWECALCMQAKSGGDSVGGGGGGAGAVALQQGEPGGDPMAPPPRSQPDMAPPPPTPAPPQQQQQQQVKQEDVTAELAVVGAGLNGNSHAAAALPLIVPWCPFPLVKRAGLCAAIGCGQAARGADSSFCSDACAARPAISSQASVAAAFAQDGGDYEDATAAQTAQAAVAAANAAHAAAQAAARARAHKRSLAAVAAVAQAASASFRPPAGTVPLSAVGAVTAPVARAAPQAGNGTTRPIKLLLPTSSGSITAAAGARPTKTQAPARAGAAAAPAFGAGDDVARRASVRADLTRALRGPSGAANGVGAAATAAADAVDALAARIESALFNYAAETVPASSGGYRICGAKYKGRAKTLTMFLGDAANGRLREMVLGGALQPVALVQLLPRDLTALAAGSPAQLTPTLSAQQQQQRQQQQLQPDATRILKRSSLKSNRSRPTTAAADAQAPTASGSLDDLLANITGRPGAPPARASATPEADAPAHAARGSWRLQSSSSLASTSSASWDSSAWDTGYDAADAVDSGGDAYDPVGRGTVVAMAGPAWRGTVRFPEVAEFAATFRQVSGRTVHSWGRLIQGELTVDGRIPTSVARDYLAQRAALSATKAVVVVRFGLGGVPGDDNDGDEGG
ncbi:CXXC-type zinc finger protein 1, partial [Cladochytrium tenue]